MNLRLLICELVEPDSECSFSEEYQVVNIQFIVEGWWKYFDYICVFKNFMLLSMKYIYFPPLNMFFQFLTLFGNSIPNKGMYM